MLSKEEEVGIKLLVYARTGRLNMFTCSQCNEILMDKRNCIADPNKDVPVWFHPEFGQFTVCPIKFITSEIFKWIDYYDYITKFPHTFTIPYHDVNPNFWESVKLYDRLMTEFEIETQKNAIEKVKRK